MKKNNRLLLFILLCLPLGLWGQKVKPKVKLLHHLVHLTTTQGTTTQAVDTGTVYSKDSRLHYVTNATTKSVALKFIKEEYENPSLEPLILLDTSVIYSTMKNDIVSGAFIEELNLADLPNRHNKKGDTIYIDYPIQFYNCVIKNIISGNDYSPAKIIVFTKPVSFTDVSIEFGDITAIFQDSLVFRDSDLKNVAFSNCKFMGIAFSRPTIHQSQFKNNRPISPIYQGVYYISFMNSQFMKSIQFSFSLYEKVHFEECEFFQNVCFKANNNESDMQKSRKKGKWEDFKHQLDSLDFSSLNHFTFDRSIFRDNVSFDSLKMDHCTFVNTQFAGLLSLRKTRIIDSEAKKEYACFEKSFFGENAVIALDIRTAEPEKLALPLEYLEKINLSLWLDGKLLTWDNPIITDVKERWKKSNEEIKITETDKGWIELFFNSFRHFIQTSNNPDGDLKKSVLARFKDLAFDYEVRFQHDNKILNGNRWKYYRNQFLELTVDNGYKGEWTFFCSVFLIIACFAILYFFVFREEVVLAELGDEKTKILGGEDDTKRTERKNALKIANFFKTNKNNQRQYLRWTAIDIGACIMFSGRMFIALKFPLKHFIGQTRAWFVVFLFLQWIIGFIWVYLFFTYIASNYSFIAKLIGF